MYRVFGKNKPVKEKHNFMALKTHNRLRMRMRISFIIKKIIKTIKIMTWKMNLILKIKTLPTK